ncbi:2-oxo-4-hydroxy-4-carboxy-5-ureidoimidazoline decarboxylase [Actinomadura rayongensis]|uniref:2-oxo-4-hydroxy-4-carboxy-5-ureidoimidazoline decarboxylase n=1 Tax=Actinomadura rayongensis TaxID=1429076 RepID=UPI001F005BDA|nr:2-oxo-4-hydroxy-4-carboxy-5-ureidoimidazoline decarboxylase [Actinomadura rayongensis]
MTEPAGVDAFNALPGDAAHAALLACCASPVFAAEVTARRPYSDAADLHRVAAAALARLDWDDVADALAAHPRIGERAAGPDREAAWSRAEQSGMDAADDALRRALAEGNRAYEARFGHVYLVCASGLGPGALFAALRVRLGNDPGAERAVVRAELAKITALRLDRITGGGR